jgi:Cu(I)/Ag(I) efflux system membrane protein CusA/SilA
MRVLPFVVVAAIMSTAPVARAEQPATPTLTLTDAIQQALHANPELVALRADYEAARAAVPEARFLDAPMLQTQIWGWPVPILWSTGVGSDVMKPIAAPIIGGMVTSTVHVLINIPIIFYMLKVRALHKGHELANITR